MLYTCYLFEYICIDTPLFNSKKNITFTLLSSLVIGISIISSTYLIFKFFNVSYYTTIQSYLTVGTELVTLYLFVTILKFLQNYYLSENKIEELKKINLQTEINLLRSQVNPHFLFNTLNNIYFLAEKNTAKTQEAILKLSNLLSHQLYDNKLDEITLEFDIENLKNYIELELLRRDDTLLLNAELLEKTDDKKIPPMLLLPVIENAFKYSYHSGGSKAEINIKMYLENSNLTLNCINTIGETSVKENGLHGIGLKNVKRRLELLFPGKHQFVFFMDKGRFVVKMEIELNEN
jgi:two-component system, LytTR family, sensor kinase